MLRSTNITAFALLLLGIGSYFITGRQSVTALIPSFFGIAILLTGVLYAKTAAKGVAVVVAAFLALAGFGGSFSGIGSTLRLMAGESVVRPEAAIAKALMALICIIYFALMLPSLKKAFAGKAASKKN